MANGFFFTISSSVYVGRNEPESSRDMPSAGLRQVVGAEAEELGRLRDLVGGERAARNLDHRADQVVELHLLLGLHLARRLVHDLDLQIELLLEADERNHDLRLDLDAFLLHDRRGLEHRARLHRRDLRDSRCRGGSRGSRASG